jgi:hypothetical protein
MGQNPCWRGSHSCRGGFRGSLLPTGLGAARDLKGDISPTLEGALLLLCSGDVEDVLQFVIHLLHLVFGGCRQSVQERGHHEHILAAPSEGRVQHPLTVDGGGNISSPSPSLVGPTITARSDSCTDLW